MTHPQRINRFFLMSRYFLPLLIWQRGGCSGVAGSRPSRLGVKAGSPHSSHVHAHAHAHACGQTTVGTQEYYELGSLERSHWEIMRTPDKEAWELNLQTFPCEAMVRNCCTSSLPDISNHLKMNLPHCITAGVETPGFSFLAKDIWCSHILQCCWRQNTFCIFSSSVTSRLI